MTALYRAATIRAIEAAAAQSLPAGTLMQRAADAVADAAAALLRRMPAQAQVAALAGPGNNGGDA
ncbi:MAG TPA: NAD(P)H-hydrate epimerase, partial [Burkholderiaceae bacterium]|nr:NAD(P)H-hydrate epimerase [Burkholderiaceae bacterium]